MAITANTTVAVKNQIVAKPKESLNPNNILFYTTETPLNAYPKDVKYYDSMEGIHKDFTIASSTFSVANSIFAQNPNVFDGGGSLAIMPLINAVSSTEGSFTTADVDANIISFKGISKGMLNIVVDGMPTIELTDLNFTSILNGKDIAKIINEKIILYGSCYFNDLNQIVFKSNTVGASSAVVLSSPLTVPTGATDITDVGFLDIATGSTLVGYAETGETIIEAIDRTINVLTESIHFAWVITNLKMVNSTIETLAMMVQGYQPTLPFGLQLSVNSFYQLLDGGLVDENTQLKNTNTRFFFYSGSFSESMNVTAGTLSYRLSSNLRYPNSSLTGDYKTLKGVLVDEAISNEQFSQIQKVGADCYPNLAGTPLIRQSNANSTFDTVYNTLALSYRIQNVSLNVLKSYKKVNTQASGRLQVKSSLVQDVGMYLANAKVITAGEWEIQNSLPNISLERLVDVIRDQGFMFVVEKDPNNVNGVLVYTAFLLSTGISKILVNGIISE